MNTVLLAVLAMVNLLSCDENAKPAKQCIDRHLDDCESVGLPSEYGRAWCDECGDLYYCSGSHRLIQTTFPCDCIDEDGYYFTVHDDSTHPCYQETW